MSFDCGIKLSSSNPALAASLAVITKPSRPLTAYHLYFQLEREHIIQTTKSKDDAVEQNVDDSRLFGLQLDDEMPLRYHNIRLDKNWFATGEEKRGSMDQKRKHRKTHGKIAFLDLSKTVASRWATLEETDPETKYYCARVAKRELNVYKERLKAYKTSLAGNLTKCLPSSFSSTGMAFSIASSSPTFDMSHAIPHASISVQTPSLSKSESQSNYHDPSSGASGSCSSSLTISVSNDASFQLCSDFQPEWMNNDEVSSERPAKLAGSSFPSTTMTSTTSQTDHPDWYPEPLLGWMSKQAGTSQSVAWGSNSIAGTRTNAKECHHSEAEHLPKLMSAEPATNEFSFHPVQCEAEDSFLKKYRKLARRTSLFSIHPLNHQLAPFSQSLSYDNSKSNIGLRDVMDYENMTDESAQHLVGFGSVQRRLRTELDERMSFLKGGWRKGEVQPMPMQSTSNEGDRKIAGKKRLSSGISETDKTEELVGFAANDVNMIRRALYDDEKKISAP